MITNPEKFQSLIISLCLSCKLLLKMKGIEITPESSVSLLNIKFSDKLDFDKSRISA